MVGSHPIDPGSIPGIGISLALGEWATGGGEGRGLGERGGEREGRREGEEEGRGEARLLVVNENNY